MENNIEHSNRKNWIIFCITIWTFLIAAILFCIPSYFEIKNFLVMLSRIEKYIENDEANQQFKHYDEKIFNFKDPDKMLICYGDEKQKTNELKFKALHERFPKNKIYLAKYIGSFKTQKIIKDYDYDSLTKKEKDIISSENKRFRKALDYAEKIEPENALYNYYRCHSYLTEAIIKIEPEEQFNYKQEIEQRVAKKFQKFPNAKRYQYKIIDENKLNLATAEYFKAISKPYLKSYALNLTRKRLSLKFSKTLNIYQFVEKMYVEYGTLLPHISIVRSTARAMNFKAKIAFAKGDIKSTKKIYTSWKPFITQSSQDIHSLIEIFVNIEMENLFLANACDFYHQINDQKSLNKIFPIYVNATKFKSYMINAPINLSTRIDKMPLLTGFLVSSIRSKYSNEEYVKKASAEKMVWYKLFEKIIVESFYYGNLASILFSYFIIAWIVKIILKRRKKLWSKQQLFLVANRKEWWVMFFLGFAIPVAIYLLITHIDYLSGREYSMKNAVPFVFQLFFLIISIMITPFFSVYYLISKYFRKNNLKTDFIAKLLVFLMSMIYLITLLLAIEPINKLILENNSNFVIYIYIFAILDCLIHWVILIYLIFTIFTKKLFHKLLVINYLPYFAIISFISATSFVLIFAIQERYYFSKDDILAKDINIFVTTIEHNAIEDGKKYLKEKILNINE